MNKPKSFDALEKQQKKLEQQMEAGEQSLANQLQCPPELSPSARQEWDRVVAELTTLGVLSKFDKIPLSIYCEAYSLWLDAVEAIKVYGAVVKSRNGFPVQSPYLTIRNREEDTMLRIAIEFGFTPASRIRKFPYRKSNSMLLVSEVPVEEPDFQPFPRT